MNRIISTKDLSNNAKVIKKALTIKNTKILFAKDMNLFVKNHLGCSLRTAQRTIKELYHAGQITSPIVYRVTLKV